MRDMSIKNRELVIPGQLIGENLYHGLNCFRDDKWLFSAVRGMVRVDGNRVRIIPSSGTYIPQEGDVVIGVIKNLLVSRWIVDINSAYECSLSSEEVSRELKGNLDRYYKVGDIISAKISGVNEIYSTQIIRPWKMENGRIVNVNPKRVPRVVGRKKSMLNMIKEKTGCKIVVGQNGRIWVKGEKSELVVEIIKRIEREALTQGLTDRIKRLLEQSEQEKWIMKLN